MVLITLLASNAYAEKVPDKPYKVCPTEARPKDYPCIAMGPTSVIAHRQVVPQDKNVITKEKIVYVDNPALIERIKELEAQLRELQSR